MSPAKSNFHRPVPRILAATLALAAAALAGCAPIHSAHAGASAPETATTQCSEARFAGLIGQSPAQIDMSRLPTAHRTICFGCMATMDFSPDRLTLQLGPDGKVASIRCG